MNTGSHERPVLRRAGAFLAILLIGVAFAVAQNQPAKKNDARAPAAAPQANAPTAAVAKAEVKAKAVRRGHGLGMTVEGGDQGIVITKIEQGGIAGKAGFREKDKIVSIDHRPFKHARRFEAYLASQGGRPVPVVVQRDGQQQTIVYTPPFRAGDSAWLGVYLEDGDDSPKGAQISQVYPDGPAARAGLESGDVITQVGNEKIESAADLIATVAGMAPNTEAQFTITRNEQPETIPVTLGAHHQQGVMPYGNPHEEGGQQAENNPFDTIPPHAMRLEHDRRNAEQHERIESEIRALREEIHQLREELKQSRSN
jgi:membrane-associated protease RseP (regulator of RpoE activity)